jgi:hypothetical protein
MAAWPELPEASSAQASWVLLAPSVPPPTRQLHAACTSSLLAEERKGNGVTDLQRRIEGLLLLLFGLFTAWGVHRPWYPRRSAWARVWFRALGARTAQVLLTVVGVAFAVVGVLMLCGVRLG